MDWLLNELVTRFNAVVQQFNEIVDQFNKLSEKVDNLEADYTQFKQETEELLKQIELIADKLNPETIDELLSLVDDFDKVQDALDKLQTDLAAEETARTEADNTLQAAIDKEVTDRTAADTTLQAAIDKEVTDRTAADKTLQDQIDSLTEGSGENAGAIGNLRDELAAEKSAREAGDSALQTAINKEVTDRTAAVSSLQTEIGTLTTAIQDETKARTDADSLLQTGISGNATNITNLTSRVAALETSGNNNTLTGFISRAVAITDTATLFSSNNLNVNVAAYLWDTFTAISIKPGTSTVINRAAYIILNFDTVTNFLAAIKNATPQGDALIRLAARQSLFDLYTGTYEAPYGGLAEITLPDTEIAGDMINLSIGIVNRAAVQRINNIIYVSKQILLPLTSYPYNNTTLTTALNYKQIILAFPGYRFSRDLPITFYSNSSNL